MLEQVPARSVAPWGEESMMEQISGQGYDCRGDLC